MRHDALRSLTLVALFLPCCSLLAPDAEGIVGTRDAGAAGSGGVTDCGSSSGADYEVRRVPAGQPLTIDGTCSESAWLDAPVMQFVGPSNSDNSSECRLLWDPTGSPRLFGCCVVQDTDLRASQTVHDSDVYLDDAVEYFLRDGADAVIDAAGTVKVFFNILGTSRDESYPGADPGYESGVVVEALLNGTLNDAEPDTSYTLEWSSVLSTLPLQKSDYRCAFAVKDTDLGADGGDFRTSAVSFPGPANIFTINEVATWGTCHFSCLDSDQ